MAMQKQKEKSNQYFGNLAYHISANEETELKSTQKFLPLFNNE